MVLASIELHQANVKWFAISIVVIVIDQVTKYIATQQLIFSLPYPVFPGFNLTLVHNTGAAFSFLQSAGGWQRYFFIGLALGVSLLMIVWVLRLPKGQNCLAIAVTLVLGGAVGNLLDRLYLGYVIDFFHLYYDKWHWPVFNIADSAITVGAILLIIDAIWLDHASVSMGSPQQRSKT